MITAAARQRCARPLSARTPGLSWRIPMETPVSDSAENRANASDPSATELLLASGRTGGSGAERLFQLVYAELHELARGYMKRERADHTLQPTILVHDAFLRLIDQSNVSFNDRGHFFALAARCMRQVLVDHARRRGAQKRGGDWEQVSLSQVLPGRSLTAEGLLQLDDALQRLAGRDERAARVVELRFFGGLTIAEVAQVLGVASSTVETDWSFARAWLGRELEP